MTGYAEFQERWEQQAGAEFEQYVGRPAAALVADVQAGRYGEHYQLWRALAARATLAEAGGPLVGVLRGRAPYLVRYHAAAALLELLGSHEVHPVDLAADRPQRAAAIDAIEAALRDRLGGPGAT